MENASKALIIAGSTLITVMIIAIAVYLFGRGQNFSRETSSTYSEAEIKNFNSKIVAFETEAIWNTVPEINSTNEFNASANLDTISDVVSAINLASNINYTNNYGYRYTGSSGSLEVEVANAVEVVVDFTNGYNHFKDDYNNEYPGKGSDIKEYGLVEPNENAKAGNIYFYNDMPSTRNQRLLKTFNSSNEVSLSNIMKVLNQTKLKQNTANGKQFTIYKYYFKCTVEFDEITAKANSISFSMIENKNF